MKNQLKALCGLSAILFSFATTANDFHAMDYCDQFDTYWACMTENRDSCFWNHHLNKCENISRRPLCNSIFNNMQCDNTPRCCWDYNDNRCHWDHNEDGCI